MNKSRVILPIMPTHGNGSTISTKPTLPNAQQLPPLGVGAMA
ncbi:MULTISPECIES: hypothetical protein [unclassified Moraxella]|nr:MULTISPECIES: hypothetical protein [unclassified Moraxella]